MEDSGKAVNIDGAKPEPLKVETFDIDKYANLIKLVTRDLNQRYGQYVCNFTPRFTKADIIKFLAHPDKFEKELRRAVRYVYNASPHFRRLIEYFVGLSDLSYYISPYRIDPKKANKRIVNNNYRSTLSTLSAMSIKTQFPKILSVCLREDIFFGTMWVSEDTITIQQLNSDYCQISSIEGNVCNVSFDFSYFDMRPTALVNFPAEFARKYDQYKNDKKRRKWIELDSPTSFAIKCNTDFLDYAIPPFAGILPELFDIEAYKRLKMDGAELDNYAMLAMYVPYEDGQFKLDYDRARKFWNNLDEVLPEQIGSVLTPMKMDKFSFERSTTADEDTVSEAEKSLFTAAGVSSLLFNNDRASGAALLLSIKVDQAMTFRIVKSIEDMVNRYIQSQKYGKTFKVTFLDCSRFNQKELGDAYLKAFSYGLPTISMYAASQGLGQEELDSMSFLETEVLGLQKMFRPPVNSAQMGSVVVTDSDDVGAPEKDIGDLTDSGEVSRERDGG